MSGFQVHIPLIRGMLLVFATAVFPSSFCAAQDTFRVNTTASEPFTNARQTGFLDRIAGEIFARLGMKVSMTRLPGERSLINVNEGLDDGTLVRIEGLDLIYPNLVQVPEKIRDNQFVVFSKHVRFRVSGWNSLEPYDVAFINGWKIMEENVRGVRSVTRVRNARELFYLLENDRVDVVLFEKWTGLHWIRSSGRKNIRMLDPVLAERPMFMYLNKKHEKLLPELSEAIRAIKQDGTYQKIFDETLGPLIAK